MKLLKLVPFIFLSTNLYATPIATTLTKFTGLQGGKVDQKTTITAAYQASLFNNSMTSALFHLKFTLCAPEQPTTCIYKYDVIAVPLGQYYIYDTTLTYDVMFRAAGQHYILAQTEVTGDAKSTNGVDEYITVNY